MHRRIKQPGSKGKGVRRSLAVLVAALMISVIMPVTAFAAEYDSSEVKAVQETLSELGFECGPVDGVAGTKTLRAIKEWQELSGVEADGVIDEELLSEMHIKEDGSAVVGDSGILSEIPLYSGEPYIAIDDNEPSFSKFALSTTAFERYSALDSLGRCGTAYVNVCEDTMPTEKRGSIGSIKPSGWQVVKYDEVDGKYLYNRCHLVGYQLSGENANEENLITGTRYMNTEGMLPFENMVADYVKETDNHVLYRVTPLFDGDNLVASGVEIEAESVEDSGESISFNVFCYNVQPGIFINYKDGSSSELENAGSSSQSQSSNASQNSQGSQSSNASGQNGSGGGGGTPSSS